MPIHPGLFPDQVEHIVRDCGMSGLIVEGGRWKSLAPALERCPSLRYLVSARKSSASSSSTGSISNGSSAEAASDLDPGRRRRFEFPSIGAAATADVDSNVVTSFEPFVERAIDKDLAAILYTSGSTGKPKGVMLSHANVVAGASIVSQYLRISGDDRILAVLPFSFDAGLNQLTTAVQQGGVCVMMKFLFAKEIVAMAAKERITGLAGVPPLWNLLVQDSSRLAETPLPHLRYVTNTGGAMPQATLARLRAAIPDAQVVLMYGLTEAFRSTYLPPDQLDRRPTSIGKAIPNTEILVLDENDRPCGPGETGELVHRGPTVSLGYWGQPELTARVLRPHPLAPSQIGDQERVCYSGDLVKRDEDGYLYFVGRRDNLIKSSGFRISPNEVEEALCKTGELREAAVIGLPDDALGQRIVAFAVPREGVEVSVDALLAKTAAFLPRFMVPKTIELTNDLPKTSSGKIDYPKLRERASAADAD
ncbi:MAG: AMP-binding protein [Isosphaeraceae bacterium]